MTTPKQSLSDAIFDALGREDVEAGKVFLTPEVEKKIIDAIRQWFGHSDKDPGMFAITSSPEDLAQGKLTVTFAAPSNLLIGGLYR